MANDTKLDEIDLSDNILQAIKIYKLTGKHLETILSNKKVEQIDFSDFEQGIYSKKVQYY